jgi:Putative MetA-pathway of phenol degradation
MFTQLRFTGQKSNAISEATFVVEREVGARADLFVEYVGDYPNHDAPRQFINSGAEYRFTRTQQIDFRAGFGLTSKYPSYFFGVGYSIRFDGLF